MRGVFGQGGVSRRDQHRRVVVHIGQRHGERLVQRVPGGIGHAHGHLVAVGCLEIERSIDDQRIAADRKSSAGIVEQGKGAGLAEVGIDARQVANNRPVGNGFADRRIAQHDRLGRAIDRRQEGVIGARQVGDADDLDRFGDAAVAGDDLVEIGRTNLDKLAVEPIAVELETIAASHACTREIEDLVAVRLADDEPEDIVPARTGQLVRTGPAIQRVVAASAGELVGQIVANARKVAAADIGQILDIIGEHIAIGGNLDQIRAFAGVLDHNLIRGIDQVSVVAKTTDQRILAATTIE